MFTKAAALAVLTALAAAAPAQDQGKCGGGHIIAVRGSLGPGEPCKGHDALGGLDAIIDPVKVKDKDVTSTAIKYPAAVDGQCGTTYVASRTEAIKKTRSEINSYVKKCGSKSNIVLLGYSQGAQAISDLISGGSDTGEKALDDKGRKALAAVVLIADPAQVPGAKYDVGKTDGVPIFQTANPGKLDSLGKAIVAYCHKGDAVCDSAEEQDGVHEREIDIWHKEAINFIEKRVK